MSTADRFSVASTSSFPLTSQSGESLSMSAKPARPVKLGLERLLEDSESIVKGARVGLICNQASVNHQYRHAADLLHAHPEINLQVLFGPQHGIRGDVQD